MRKPTNIELGQVIVELTRRCNMNCPHCLRGEPENRKMSDRTMDSLIAKLDGHAVGSMWLGGGESMLEPGRVCRLLDEIDRSGNYPSCFGFVTNGKKVSTQVVNALLNVASYTSPIVAVSRDDMHEYVDVESMAEKMSALLAPKSGVEVNYMRCEGEVGTFAEKYMYDSSNILMMGRGANIGTEQLYIKPYDVVGETPLSDSQFYVAYDGSVWPCCDLSYEFMRSRPEFCLGNVNDDGFDWYEAAIKFNVRHMKNVPIVAEEPGYEGMADPGSTRWRIVERTEEIMNRTKRLLRVMRRAKAVHGVLE